MVKKSKIKSKTDKIGITLRVSLSHPLTSWCNDTKSDTLLKF